MAHVACNMRGRTLVYRIKRQIGADMGVAEGPQWGYIISYRVR